MFRRGGRGGDRSLWFGGAIALCLKKGFWVSPLFGGWIGNCV